MVRSKYEMQTPNVLGGFIDKLPEYYGAYNKRKELETDAKTIEDPNASPLQRSLAISRAYGSPMGAQFMKSYEAQQQGQMANALEQDLQTKLQGGQAGQPVQPIQPATPVQPGNQPNIGGLMEEFSPQQEVGMNQAQQVQPQQQQPQDPIQIMKYQAETYDKAAQKASSMGLKDSAAKYQHKADQIRQDLRSKEQADSRTQSALIKTAQKREDARVNKVLPIQDEAMKLSKSTDNALRSLDDQLTTVMNDKVGILSGANISKYLKDNEWSDAIVNAFQTPGGALFNTAGKEVITATLKPAFGARPLGVEFEAVVDMLAQTGRRKEVNEITIKALKIPAEIDNAVSKFTIKTISENPEISPIELNSKIFEYREQVRDLAKENWDQEMHRILQTGAPERKQISLFGNQKNTQEQLQNIWK